MISEGIVRIEGREMLVCKAQGENRVYRCRSVPRQTVQEVAGNKPFIQS